MANEIVIDASALESVNYETFFSSYFGGAGSNSYLFYDGDVKMAYGRPQYMGGNQVGMTYANSTNQVVWGGTDIAYDFIHRGNGNHAITGAVDTLSFSFTTSTDYTRDATGTSPLTGILSDLLISNLDIDVTPGSSAAYDLVAGTGNLAHALWDILGSAGTSAEAVANLYALLSLRGQHFIGTTGNDTYTGTSHDDIIEMNGGNDVVNGGAGTDRFVVNGNIADFEITAVGLGYTVEGAGWKATLTNVELVVFDDGEVNIATTPSNLALSKSSVNENAKAGTVVGQLSAVDPNGDTLTYSLAKPSAFFEVKGNKLVVKKGADYETAKSHTVEVQVKDPDGNTATRTFTIAVNDVNERPDSLKISKTTVKENVKVGTVVGKLSAHDVDGDKLTYSLADGSSKFFKVVGNTLVVAKGLDYETLKSHTVTLVATDAGGLKTTLKVNIGVTDTIDVINGGKGANVIKGGSGVDHIHGGAGNDTVHGNAGNDKLYGDSGNDKLYGGAGNDQLFGGSGKDVLEGGAGNDKLDGGTGSDKLYGGAGKDDLSGGFGNDKLYGGDGNDLLKGGAGNDRLYGDAGNDTLYGGVGADKLYGGAGADTFVFLSADESTVGKSGRDVIYGFNSKQGDRIDLSGFDANVKVDGTQAFTFIGESKPTGKAGELGYTYSKGSTLVYGDLDGDAKADFIIRVDGVHHLTASDFLL